MSKKNCKIAFKIHKLHRITKYLPNMAFYLLDPCKTDIEENEIKYIASQAMLRCNANSYVDFLMQKLRFVKANDDPSLRLEMIQDDKWLSAGFDRFHDDSNSFPTTPLAPLYICKPNQFKRVLCEDQFCCGRNFKGERFACPKCENDHSHAKRQKYNPCQLLPKNVENSVSPSGGMGTSSTGSNGSNGSAIRAARAIDAASWRKENYSNTAYANPKASTSNSDEDSD